MPIFIMTARKPYITDRVTGVHFFSSTSGFSANLPASMQRFSLQHTCVLLDSMYINISIHTIYFVLTCLFPVLKFPL